MTKLDMTPEVLARFWAKVDVKSADECWLWTASLNSKGYGSFAIKGSGVSAHKISWALAKNDGILSGPKDHIMHSCDVRSCVNPSHLSLGTAKDNSRDAVAKGRNFTRTPSQDATCKNGHPRTPENTDAKYNTCAVCRRESNRKSKAKARLIDREGYNAYHREWYRKSKEL
jgi:hypothetical protein